MNVLDVQIKPAANRRLNIDSCFHSTVRRPTENNRVKRNTQYDIRNTRLFSQVSDDAELARHN